MTTPRILSKPIAVYVRTPADGYRTKQQTNLEAGTVIASVAEQAGELYGGKVFDLQLPSDDRIFTATWAPSFTDEVPVPSEILAIKEAAAHLASVNPGNPPEIAIHGAQANLVQWAIGVGRLSIFPATADHPELASIRVPLGVDIVLFVRPEHADAWAIVRPSAPEAIAADPAVHDQPGAAA